MRHAGLLDGPRRDLVVRRARTTDLAELTAVFDQNAVFTDWLARQDAQRGELYVALLDGQVVGTIYLWLEDADEPKIRQRLPRVPLLRHLRVSSRHQGNRIGTTLVNFAEGRLRRSRHTRVALPIDVKNVKAARLYERLGYRKWRFGPVECLAFPSGNGSGTTDTCHVMVKSLVT